MVNSTTILRYLEKKLGYRFNDLEISPNDIIENIQEETLETFSKYFPYSVRHKINIEQDRVPGTENQFYIKTDLPIMSVKKVYLSNSYYGNLRDINANNFSGGCRNFVDSQMQQDLLSGLATPITFNFIYPNIVEIFPAYYTKGSLLIDINCVHPKDFSSINLNMKDEFLKLCLYDTQDVLYQIRHRFANLQTAYGSIELFIDDLQNAQDKKDELIEKWRKNYYKDSNRKKLYIY